MPNTRITLTPNRRLARHLYQTAAISINQWLEACYHKSKDPRTLLNIHQERLLWQKIITDTLGAEFIDITDTIIKAYNLLVKWQISYQESYYDSQDFMVFTKIKQKFEDYCTKHNLVTASKLPSVLIPYIEQIQPKINLLGFDEYWPQLQTLFAKLKVTKQDPNNHQNSLCKSISCNSTSDEITIAARWAKQILINNPKAKIGVVINNLTDLRTQIIRIFTQILGDNNSFNISVGETLSAIPIIQYTLELLNLHEPISFNTISKLLLSSYLQATPEEKSNRILLEWQLQQHIDSKTKLYIKDLEYFAKKYQNSIPEFITVLIKVQEVIKDIDHSKLSNTDWIKVFKQILQVVGWPNTSVNNESILAELELQAIDKFDAVLQELSSIDLITSKVYYRQSLRILRNLLDNTVFQTSTKNNPQIQILGILEAAGINFDYLWIMGVDQKNFPRAANPNPFIPIKLQKQFDLPQSSAEHELKFYTKLIHRFKRSAANIIFSYVNQEADRVINPSPLIADIKVINSDDLDLANFIDPAKQIYLNKNILTTSHNDQLNQIALMPHESIHGSSKLIEMQSLCPFRAFTEFRLKVTEVKKIAPGVSKITRGVLLHKILEQFWQQIKTKQNLCAQTPHNLHDIIQDKIHYALDKERIPKHLYHLEQQCLTKLIYRWLEIEKNRDDFTVIATEKTLTTTIGALTIQLRVDRIDRLADGSLLVIDYKSGKILPSISNWFGARPINIQLPIYCLAIDKLQGLALAQVNTQSLKLKTIGLEELSTGIQTEKFLDWAELTNYWRKIFATLAQDFVGGNAKVDPLTAQVCQTCAFGLICRK